MKPLLRSLVLSFAILGISIVLVAVFYDDPRKQLNPLSPGMWVSDHLVPRYGECTSKQIPYNENLAMFYLFGTNILLYWIIAYWFVLHGSHRKKESLP